MSNTQKTIKKTVSIEGIGLHTGKKSKVIFNPARADTGILFIRKDIQDKIPVKANIESLLDIDKYPRRTSIGNENFYIHTIEHLLSALFAMEIDNIFIEIEGEECPGLDGSSFPFVKILKNAGIKKLEKPKEIFMIREPIYISENGSHIIALPSEKLKVSYTLDYPGSLLKSQYASFVIEPETYEKEIAPARTFCLEEEVEKLKELGLGKGSDYSNTLVIGKTGIINNKFRFQDEPVRHKILDLIGDLALFGNSFSAHIIGIRSGHALNTQLIKKIKDITRKEKPGGVKAPTLSPIPSQDLTTEDIEKIIPHRYPFLLVDKILEIEIDKKAIGIKNVSINEWFFQGHFPGKPVMPGVLIVEAMAQVAGVLTLSKKENRGKLAYFMSIDKVKFRKTIKPGDQLIIEVEVVKLKSKTGQINGKTYVDGKLAVEASLLFSIVDA